LSTDFISLHVALFYFFCFHPGPDLAGAEAEAPCPPLNLTMFPSILYHVYLRLTTFIKAFYDDDDDAELRPGVGGPDAPLVVGRAGSDGGVGDLTRVHAQVTTTVRYIQHIGNESVPKITINDKINSFLKMQSAFW